MKRGKKKSRFTRVSYIYHSFFCRLTAEQALQHPYLADYSDPSDEPISEPFDDSFEDSNLSVTEWKSKTVVVV